MIRKFVQLTINALICVFYSFAQTSAPAVKPIPMPADRVADSYRIYSNLIPLGETGNDGWPRDLWLVEDTTVTVVLPDQPCVPSKTSSSFMSNNPHIAVHPPADQQQNYLEILHDFDLHCHEKLALDPNAWKLAAPVRLLTPKEQTEFQSTRSRNHRGAVATEKYKGAPALYGFSEVYFNFNHTVALVYATHWCGDLCGEGFWTAFTLDNGEWKQLRWNSEHWIS
jgi:hypothetical protein